MMMMVVVRLMYVVEVVVNRWFDSTAVHTGASRHAPQRHRCCCFTKANQLLTPCVQQSPADGGSSGSTVDADVSLLRSHLRHDDDDVAVLCRFHDVAVRPGSDTALHPTSALTSSSRYSTLTSPPSVASSAAVSSGGAGSRERTKADVGAIAAGSEIAAASVGSGAFVGRGFQARCRSWFARVMKALQWLRLLGLWQPLRRVAATLLQPVGSALMSVFHAVRRSSGVGQIRTMRQQQLVLALASIVLMVIHMQSDRL